MSLELTRLCQILIDALNDRDLGWTSPAAHELRWRHVAGDFSARLDAHAWTMSFDEQVDAWQRMVDEHPEMRFELVDVHCAVRDADRTADVTLHTVTHRGRLRMLFVCQQKWKFSGNRWLWHSTLGMRGVPEITERL